DGLAQLRRRPAKAGPAVQMTGPFQVPGISRGRLPGLPGFYGVYLAQRGKHLVGHEFILLQQVLERTPDLPEESGPSPALALSVCREDAKPIMAGSEGKSKGKGKKFWSTNQPQDMVPRQHAISRQAAA